MSLCIGLEILAASLFPLLTDFNFSGSYLKNRSVDEVQSAINITGIIDGTSTTWWNISFHYRKTITINHSYVKENINNYPMLVHLSSDADLSAFAQPDGDDICFVYRDTLTQLHHEIELYNSSIGELIAWVNVTSVSSSSDKKVDMYFGNSTCSNQENIEGTWDAHFTLVQHLNETTGSPLFDSTANANDGQRQGGTKLNASGKIDGAYDFNGTSDYINISASASMNFDASESYTWSAWIYPTRNDSTIFSDAASLYGFWIFIDLENYITIYSGIDYRGKSTSPVVLNSWNHIAVTYQNGAFAFYVNEELAGSDSKSFSDSSEEMEIGVWYSYSVYLFHFSGVIDEAQISNTVRSEGWIKTCYVNQNYPSSFYHLGSLTTRYLTVTVENTGSVSLTPNKFLILVNGTKYQSECNHTFLFPLMNASLYITTPIASGAKRIKVISDIGAEDYYDYAG